MRNSDLDPLTPLPERLQGIDCTISTVRHHDQNTIGASNLHGSVELPNRLAQEAFKNDGHPFIAGKGTLPSPDIVQCLHVQNLKPLSAVRLGARTEISKRFERLDHISPNDIRRGTRFPDQPSIEPDRLLAQGGHHAHIVTDEDDRPSFPGGLLNLRQTFSLEVSVADGENFVDNEDVGIKMSGHGEGQTNIHAVRVPFDRGIEETINTGELDDLVKFPSYLRTGHSENCAVEKDVLTTCELLVKPRSNLKETGHTPDNLDPPTTWISDTRQYLQQSRLSGAIASDKSHNISRPNIEADIPQGPELFGFIARHERASAKNITGGSHSSTDTPDQSIPQGRHTIDSFVPDQILLADGFSGYDQINHQITSANVRSVARKVFTPNQKRNRLTAQLTRKPGQ